MKIKAMHYKKGSYLRDKDFHGLTGVTRYSLEFWNEVKNHVGEVVKAEMKRRQNDDLYLVLYTTKDIKVCLYGVNAGYGGEGPRGSISILTDAGFNEKRVTEVVYNNETFTLRRKAKKAS